MTANHAVPDYGFYHGHGAGDPETNARRQFALRDELVERVERIGAATALDVGCGLGLIAIGVARALPHCAVIGVDLWDHESLHGNSMAKARRNAELEGVADRVRFDTADARALPFPDGAFDTVVSNLVYHNIPERPDRQRAYREALRVLRPGGTFIYCDGLWQERQREDVLAAGFRLESETAIAGNESVRLFMLTRPA